MKKTIKAVLTTLVLSFALVGCGSVSQNYADKINDLVRNDKKDDELTYEQVEKDLGKPTTGVLVLGAGVCVWVKGCKTVEEANQKVKDGKKVEALTVTFAGSKAVAASYGEYKAK